MVTGPAAELRAPATGPWLAVHHALAFMAGRSGLWGWSFDRAVEALAREPRTRAVPLAFAEGQFGRSLLTGLNPRLLDRFLVDVVSDGHRTLRLAHNFLDAGDWEGALLPLSACDEHREVDALFEADGALASHPAFLALVEAAARGRPAERNGVVLDGPVTIQAYFDHYRALRDSIVRHGFLPRGSARSSPLGISPIRGRGERREREIGIAIGPDGRPVRMVGGRHRTAIAQRLGLRRVPVGVRLVHTDWVQGISARSGEPPRRVIPAAIARLGEDAFTIAPERP